MLKQACREGNIEHVKGYVREGMRLAPQFAGLLRTVSSAPWEETMIEEGSGEMGECIDVLVMTGRPRVGELQACGNERKSRPFSFVGVALIALRLAHRLS